MILALCQLHVYILKQIAYLHIRVKGKAYGQNFTKNTYDITQLREIAAAIHHNANIEIILPTVFI